MILKQIILKNYRGYCGEHRIDVSEGVTALIGKNDAGKSTILEALAIFYNESKPELTDLNIYASDRSDREMLFGAVFSQLPEIVKVDSTAETSLEAEYLINADGDFEVVIRYACTANAISAKPETIIRCQHPTTENCNDLLNLKLTELKARGKTLGVEVKDDRVNNLWRKAIWASASQLNVKELELRIEDFDSKAKAVYSNIAALFPQYYLFRVDRQTSDSDAEAKDPMQLAVKEAQKEYQDEIQGLQMKIQERVDEVAERALLRLQEMDASLASQLKPTIKGTPKWSFDYRINDERGISLNKRGSGTRRLVLLNFFRAEAERKSQTGSGCIIYAIEEPETSQHPNNQKMIIDALLELSKDESRQVIITSHSPQLVEKLPYDSIKFVEFDNAGENITVQSGQDALMKSAKSLGIHAKQKFGSAEAVVLVEGKDDELFLHHASKELQLLGKTTVDYIGSHKIEVLSAGGCDNVAFWVQKSTLEGLGLPYLVLLDSDRTSLRQQETKNENLIKSMWSKGLKGIVMRKREIENYIDPANTKGAVYSEYDDAKSAIAKTDGLTDRWGKPKGVFTAHWPKMSGEQIVAQSQYIDSSGKSKCELVEILAEINSLLRE